MRKFFRSISEENTVSEDTFFLVLRIKLRLLPVAAYLQDRRADYSFEKPKKEAGQSMTLINLLILITFIHINKKLLAFSP